MIMPKGDVMVGHTFCVTMVPCVGQSQSIFQH
jgi:hypothetical protein